MGDSVSLGGPGLGGGGAGFPAAGAAGFAPAGAFPAGAAAFAGSAGFPAAGAAEEAGAAAAALANLTAVTHFTASDELHTLDSILKSRNDLRWKHVSKRPRESRLFLAPGMTERVWILSSCCSHLMKLLPIPFDLLVSGSMRYTMGYGRSGIPPTVCARLSN